MVADKQQLPLDYVEVCTLFSNAEDKIKKIEHLAGGVIIPAVNQLRYAGQHLVRTLNGNGDSKEELRQAVNHCKRASFDACEAGLLYCLKLFMQFQDDYRKVSIIPILPDWLDYCALAREAQNLIQISQDDRIKSYENAERVLDNLIEIIAKLPDAREELNKNLVSERRTYRVIYYTLIFTVIGVLIAVMSNCKKQPESPNSPKQQFQNHSSPTSKSK